MKFRIILKAYKNELLNLAVEQIRHNLLEKNCKISGTISLPTKIKKFCVLRSPHVDKDSREHFELRISKRFIDIEAFSFSAIDSLLTLEIPSGVSCSLKILESIKV